MIEKVKIECIFVAAIEDFVVGNGCVWGICDCAFCFEQSKFGIEGIGDKAGVIFGQIDPDESDKEDDAVSEVDKFSYAFGEKGQSYKCECDDEEYFGRHCVEDTGDEKSGEEAGEERPENQEKPF